MQIQQQFMMSMMMMMSSRNVHPPPLMPPMNLVPAGVVNSEEVNQDQDGEGKTEE